MKRPALAAVVLLAACDPPAPEPTIAVPQPPLRVTPIADRGGVRPYLILVNTPYEVYRVAPATLDVTLLGRFTFADGVADLITDIALDQRGRMWGVGFEAVYRIDPATYECTRLATHQGLTLNSLAIMTSSVMQGRETPDVMIAAQSKNPTVYLVDPTTGALAPIGDVGGGLSSSGDITWAPGLGPVLLASDFAGYEGLVTLAPDTFTATPIGTGWSFQKVRGMSLLPTGLLAVTEQGEMLQIDATTGAATLRRTHPLVFYGGAIGWDDARP